MKNQICVEQWLKRAKSNLERAKAGRSSEEVFYEDLCFDCQQATEKSLKGLLANLSLEIPYTHSISAIINLIKKVGLSVPDDICCAATLTVYATNARYPFDQEPIGEEDYNEALVLAEQTCSWVEEKLKE